MKPSLPDAGVRRGADDLAAAAAGVTALYEHPAYRRLAGDAQRPGCALTGVSRAAADAAVARVRALLAGYETLESTGAEEIIWPEDAEAVAALLDAMTAGAQSARATLDAFEEAWRDLPELLDACASRCAALGDPADIAAQLAELRGTAEADPLGAMAALRDKITPAIERWEETRAVVLAALEQAAARLAALAGQHAAAAARVAERDARLSDPESTALPAAAAVPDLGDWREKLARSAAAGKWSAVQKALAAWTQRAEALEGEIRAAAAQAESALAERQQLRGWLRALDAKAGALHRAPYQAADRGFGVDDEDPGGHAGPVSSQKASALRSP